MKSNVSSTPEAEAWLNQFDTQDRPTAKLLLNKLQIIPSNQVFQSIEFEIGNRLNRIQTPAMLVPVTPSTSQPQNSSLFPSLQGSEGHISSICKTLVKNHPDKLFEPSNISCLKEKQCRSIIFIDDNSGSGENICNYLKSCWDNPTFGKTLKSWHSYHLLEFIILAYSITDHARGEITKNKWVDSIIPVHKTPTIWSEFKNSDLIKIEQLCKNYPKGSALPLGYQNIGSLMAFSHSAPDTLPAVFIESNIFASDPVLLIFASGIGMGAFLMFFFTLLLAHTVSLLRICNLKNQTKKNRLSSRPQSEVIIFEAR